MKFLTTIKYVLFRSSLKRYIPILSQRRWIDRSLSVNNSVQIDFTAVNVRRSSHEDKDSENVYNDPEESTSELEEYNDMFQDHDMPISVRNVLYATPIDYLMTRLNSCASVQEVFNVLKTNEAYLRHEHIAQSVLVLWDLQKIFYHVNLMNNTLTNQSVIIANLAENYYRKLDEHPDFKMLLNKIKQNCDKYDNNTIAIILLYLNRIGLNVKSDLAQLLINKFCEKGDDISLSAISRFTTVLFRNADLTSYYYIKKYIPSILNYIDNSETVEDFKLCTICLKNINKIITDGIMGRYTRTLRKHLKSGFLNSSDPKAILKIIVFLNFAQWRDDNTELIGETILLMKNKLHLLNSYELLLFYEVFYKIQEPAIILNELQRHAIRYLALFEQEAMPLLDVRLRLMLGLAAHSSHNQRAHCVRMLKQHSTYHLNRTSIFQFYKLLTYTRMIDTEVTKKLWNTVVHLLETDEVFRNYSLLRVCAYYLHYMRNNIGYRSFQLEKAINKFLSKELLDSFAAIYPIKFACIATYIITFGKNKEHLDIVCIQLEKHKHRINHVGCLGYSRALNLGKEIKNPLLTKEYLDRLQTIVNTAVINNADLDLDINANNALLKCCLYNTDKLKSNNEVIKKLIDKFPENRTFSTRILKSLVFCLHSTQTLVPKVMDDLVDYIIKSKDNVLGFNAERVLHLCCQLGYQPKKEEFFQVMTEIILRDQERFSGLSYLQACLALCYFESLPNSFIKQIFNTVFLDKLDKELANCYHKDIYPTRVRHRMMQLNRAVCIDYPALNIPWFHQKYIHEILRKANQQHYDSTQQKLVKSYLNRFVPENEYIQENVTSPYGYYINFVLNLDEDGQFVKIEDIKEGTVFKKIALLLVKSNDFTNGQVQLMGNIMLKKRHLEILGYNVVLLDIPLWKTIISGQDKLRYLGKLMNVPIGPVSEAINM